MLLGHRAVLHEEALAGYTQVPTLPIAVLNEGDRAASLLKTARSVELPVPYGDSYIPVGLAGGA